MILLLVNLVVSAGLAFGISDALYMGFIVPKQASHPTLADTAELLIVGFLFIGIFVGGLRMALSGLVSFISFAVVACICFALHFLN